MKENVGEDPYVPRMWLEKDTIPDCFVEQEKLVREELKKIEGARLQDYIDRRIEKYNLNHSSISDGHHTFGELYQYRMAYHALAVNQLPKTCEATKVSVIMMGSCVLLLPRMGRKRSLVGSLFPVS